MSEKLIKSINELILLEQAIIKSVKEQTDSIKNLPIKKVLLGISLDSEKHTELYRAVLDIISEVAPPLSEPQLESNKRLIRYHIEKENELIERLNELIPTIQDSRISFLLKAIMGDEIKHHNQLKAIEKTLLEKETVTEADYWEAAWKDYEELRLFDERRA